MAGQIENISDTALWVAAYRAMETERGDAIFSDPYARGLAGPRGEQIAKRMGRESSWAVTVRTAVMDEMLMRRLRDSRTGCVLNLGAGLDTRPYRLDLPRELHWIEVDLPATIEYKERSLATERPTCVLERVPVDLADASARALLLDRVNEGGRDTLVLTEGLLVYLDFDQVTELSADLAGRGHMRSWLLDLAGPVVLERLNRGGLRRNLDAGHAPMRFAPAAGPAFFHPQGWRPTEIRYAWDEARRLNREPSRLRLLRQISTSRQQQPYREIARYLLLERD